MGLLGEALNQGTWLSDGLLLLVGRFGGQGTDVEASAVVGDRRVPLEARSLFYLPSGEKRGRHGKKLVALRLPRDEGIDTRSLALQIRSGRRTFSLSPTELRAALTDLRAFLRTHLMGLGPHTREEMLELILASASELTRESYSLSPKLFLVREALREPLPRCVIRRHIPQGLRIDLILAVDETSFWIKGWVRDKEATAARLVAISPEGATADILDGAFRYARPEMDEYYGDPGEEKGFIKYLELPAPSRLATGWIAQLRDVYGGGIEADAPEVISDIVTVRNTVLEDLKNEFAHSDRLTLNHGHPALGKVQEQLRKAVEVKSVVHYGTPNDSPDISIVIPLYRRIDYLEHQLAQFANDPEIKRADLIYVLDSPELANAVSDMATALHRLHRVPFRVVTLKSNVGFPNANNVGASVARGRLLLLLNSDILPDRQGWLGEMAKFYDATPKIGALGAKLLYEDDTLQHAGMYFEQNETSQWGNLHYFKGLHRSVPAANVARRVPAVTGACLMIERELYEELDGLRDIYMLGGYEDSDLCLRLDERGLESWYLPSAELYHLEAQSFTQPAEIRKLATRYNLWLHTHLWRDRIEQIMGAFPREEAARPGAFVSAGGQAVPQAQPQPAPAPPARAGVIDVDRTCLQKLFFEKFDGKSGDALVAAVESLEFDVDELASSRDSRVYVYSGWVYWFLFLKGYLEYLENGAIDSDNTYYDYLRNHYIRDPGISEQLDDQDSAAEHAARQFRDMDVFRDRARDPDLAEDVAPLLAIVTSQPTETSLRVFEEGSEEPLTARRVDGWHRLFAAKVFGVPRLRCEFVQEEENLKPLPGAIDDLSLDDKNLRIRGWCLDPDGPITGVEVRAGERLVGVAGTATTKPLIGEAFEPLPHGAASGFLLDCEHDLELDGFAHLELTALRELLPVGKMNAYYIPGMFEERTWPPEALARRTVGISDRRKLALMSVKTLREMLEPVARFRKLDSFESVLDWGCSCGFLEMFMEQTLPGAEVTGIDVDEEAIEWCRKSGLPGTYLSGPTWPPADLPSGSFDLVLGHLVLPRLIREAQSAWLSEIDRVLRSGGYAALTLYGESMRRFITDHEVMDDLDAEGIFDRANGHGWQPRPRINGLLPTYQTRAYTSKEYARWLDVVAYIEGGVNGHQDLVVLHKR